jgi:hypothetical protein
VPVYGYIKDPADKRKLIIDEPAAQVVRRIFDLAEQGFAPIQIAKTLNDEGVPSPHEYKKQNGLLKHRDGQRKKFWSGSTVSNLIHDIQYTGKLIYGKTRVVEVGKNKMMRQPENEWTVTENAIPAIIGTERFDSINQIMPKTPVAMPRKRPTELLFSRKLKCGLCDMSLVYYPIKHGVKYYCRTPALTDEYGCSADRLYDSDIASVVLVALQYQISIACDISKTTVKKAKAKKQPSNAYADGLTLRKEIESLLKIIDKSKTAKMSLWERYHEKTISADAFRCEGEKIDTQVQGYNAEIARLQTELERLMIADLEPTKAQDNLFVREFSKFKGLQTLTREAVVALVDEVKIFSSDKIEITFNFADAYDKIKGIK